MTKRKCSGGGEHGGFLPWWFCAKEPTLQWRDIGSIPGQRTKPECLNG